jgi:aminoglycoside phosphotransferase (APT) family kinase protein
MKRRMHADQIDSDAALVRSLLAEQFPEWADLPIEEVDSTGTDNALYRLGGDLVVRMPMRPSAIAAIDKETYWMPFLAARLPVEVPVPMGWGTPTSGFPWPWSVVSWIDGEDATTANFTGHQAAVDTAHVIAALHSIDPTGGPVPEAPYGRGVPLADRDVFTRRAIAASDPSIDTDAAVRAWEESLRIPAWNRPGVWIHGDIASGNILIRGGRLTALIDWSCLGVGDPACDLIIAWEIFDAAERALLRSELGIDEATWERGRGWALSTAVSELSYYRDTNQFMAARARRQITAVLHG